MASHAADPYRTACPGPEPYVRTFGPWIEVRAVCEELVVQERRRLGEDAPWGGTRLDTALACHAQADATAKWISGGAYPQARTTALDVCAGLRHIRRWWKGPYRRALRAIARRRLRSTLVRQRPFDGLYRG